MISAVQVDGRMTLCLFNREPEHDTGASCAGAKESRICASFWVGKVLAFWVCKVLAFNTIMVNNV